MNDLGTIALTEPELELLAQIDFEARGHDDLSRSCGAAGRLTPLLVKRGAIPQRRLDCFTLPEWGPRGKSHQQIFEGNGTRGTKIFSHGNFLKYLNFFIHGARLPHRVKSAMREQIGNPEWFSGEDVSELRTLARRLVRENGLDGSRDRDFLFLCADLGLCATDADSIRRAVREVK